MKHYTKFLFLAAAALGTASCAMQEVQDFPVDKPEYLEQYEYLKDFDVLKNYVNRETSPNFKLGAGVTASAYVEGGQEYLLAVSNFDEVTPGNAMKHASVVGNNGKMNFDQVTSLVEKAEAAGMTVYGHTLAWHSQQNMKFLNSVIADKVDPNYTPELVEVTEYVSRNCCVVEAADMVANPWDSQFWISVPTTFAEGDSWEVSMDVYALNEASPGTQFHGDPGAYLHWAAIGNVPFKTEWTTYTASGSIPAEAAGGHSVAFNLNDYVNANTYYFDNVSFKINGVEMIENGTFEDPEVNVNFFSKEYAKDPNAINPSTIVDKYAVKKWVEVPRTQEIARTCILVESQDMASAPWDTQFWIVFDDAFAAGDTWEVSMEVRAEKEASASTQTHIGPGGYIHWAAIGNVNFTPEWNTYTASGTVADAMVGGNAIAFNLNDFASANKYYFDNLSFKVNGKEQIVNGDCDDPSGTANFVAKEYPAGSGTAARIVSGYTVELPGGNTPLTPEEKKDTLTKTMDAWIKGMMEATAGKVVAWDAVNEAVSGADYNGDGKYDLQSAETGDPANNFYWQDYLGSEDYVRIVVNSARKHFEENGGVAANLKLFVNDYNLESDWDDNGKLKSLIEWIKVWEADGTKIDGIGTQMHVSYYANADIQKSKEAHVTKMFELMAATGKLVKISELDMGYIDATGQTVATVNMTEEQHQQMAQYYKFIISEYFRIIPAAQQYGITQWCTVDAAGALGTGWRGGEPVGLWDANYNRKHTYAGFAEGLQGK